MYFSRHVKLYVSRGSADSFDREYEPHNWYPSMLNGGKDMITACYLIFYRIRLLT